MEKTAFMSIDVGTVNFAYCFGQYTPTSIWITSVAVVDISRNPFKMLVDLLDSLDTLQHCDEVVIEKQMAVNIKCVRMQQHLETYFMIKHARIVVTLCPSCYKTKMYNFRSKNYTLRKKFAVAKTIELLELSSGSGGPPCTEIIQCILQASKKDDLADCILQMYALLEHRRRKNEMGSGVLFHKQTNPTD